MRSTLVIAARLIGQTVTCADHAGIHPDEGLGDFGPFIRRPTAAACASSPSLVLNHTSDQCP
jgi:hypothetical protein